MVPREFLPHPGRFQAGPTLGASTALGLDRSGPGRLGKGGEGHRTCRPPSVIQPPRPALLPISAARLSFQETSSTSSRVTTTTWMRACPPSFRYPPSALPRPREDELGKQTPPRLAVTLTFLSPGERCPPHAPPVPRRSQRPASHPPLHACPLPLEPDGALSCQVRPCAERLGWPFVLADSHKPLRTL